MSVLEFFTHNFILFGLALIMLVNAISNIRQDRKTNIFAIVITLVCIILAISYSLELHGKATNNTYLALTMSIINYSLRPTCFYFFIRMNKNSYRGKWSFLIWIPLIVNAIVYLCAFIPGTGSLIIGFYIAEDGLLTFNGGFLRFTSHIIASVYLIYLLYLSFFSLKLKHILRGLTLLICTSLVITAVILETIVADIEILNTTIMLSTFTYYLFIYMQKSQIDGLTGLFNRETYYHDLPRMEKTTTGVFHFDINGLKYINDNFGHFEGDHAIESIAHTILVNLRKNMYAYRLGGDEFLVIANNTSDKTNIEFVNRFKNQIANSKYHCSVGYAYRDNPDISLKELIKNAEKEMYKDKEQFYKNSSMDRRKA